MKKLYRNALAAFGLVATTQVEAIVLFDANADPNFANGGAIAGAIQIASDFAVKQDSFLTDVRFWTMEGTTPDTFPTGSAWNGYITYTLWGSTTDNNGNIVPTQFPVAEGTVDCNNSDPLLCGKKRTDVPPIDKGTDPISPYLQYVYNFKLLEEFELTAFTRYWLGIYLDKSNLVDSSESHGILWQYNTELFGDKPVAYPLSLGLPTSWPFPISEETAFELTGYMVPVPPTAVLLMTGLVGLIMRWRSTAITS